jgi:hypothetical protein
MSARQNCSSFVRLVLVSTLLVAGITSSSLAAGPDPASQATLTITSQVGDTIGPGNGKTYTYSTPKNTFLGSDGSLFGGAIPNAINIGVSADASNPDVLVNFFSPNTPAQSGTAIVPTPFFKGTYVCAQSSPELAFSTHVPGVSFGFSSFTSHAGSCTAYSGTFTINSIAVTTTQDPTANQPTSFHLSNLDIQFTVQCTTATGKLIGHLIFHSAPIAGAVAYDPIAAGAQSDFGTCPDGTTGSGTPGGGSGSGSGGGPTPNAPTIVLPDTALTSSIPMVNSDSATVAFSTFIPTTTTSDVSLTATTDTDNLLATVTPAVIKPGDTGDAKVTIRTTPTTFAGEHIVTLTASDGTVSSSVSIHVTVFCDPPLILGTDQPKNTTVALGRAANLSVKASGSGPFTYQWFSGAKGLVNFPLAIGSSPNFTTSAINDTTSYWVRITNPCGSVDSQTVTVSVAASAKPVSNRR